MIVAFIKAVIGISVILGGWLTVQTVWRYVTGARQTKTPWPDDLVAKVAIVGHSAKAESKAEVEKRSGTIVRSTQGRSGYWFLTALTNEYCKSIHRERKDAIARLRHKDSLQSQGAEQ